MKISGLLQSLAFKENFISLNIFWCKRMTVLSSIQCGVRSPHPNTPDSGRSLQNTKLNDLDLKLASQAIQFIQQLKELVLASNNYNFGELLYPNRFLLDKHFQSLKTLSSEPAKGCFEATKKLAFLARDLIDSIGLQSIIVHEKMVAFCKQTFELLSEHKLFVHEFIHSDLIPVSQDQLNLIPNGITHENAKIWSEFFADILQNRTAIQIDHSDSEFKNEILRNFQILAGRECGRSILLSLSMSPIPIIIKKSRSCRCMFYFKPSGKYDSIILEFNFSKSLKISTVFNSRNYIQPCFSYISLFHEMVHVYNRIFNFIVYDPPSFELFTNGEEEIAITGEYGVLSLPYSENKCRAAFGLSDRSSHFSLDGIPPERYIFGCIDLNLTGEIQRGLEKFPLTQNCLERCIFWCSEDPNRFEMAKILITYGISRGFFQGSIESNFFSLKEKRIIPKSS